MIELGADGDVVDPLFLELPLWLFGLAVLACTLLAREAGAWLHRLTARRGKAHKVESEGYIISATLGLLAFLIGLTFSIALNRYDSRRVLVAEEANAISTAYLRAGLFDEPHRGRLQDLLHEYARVRVASYDRTALEAQLRRAAELRSRLWGLTHDAVFPMRTTALASYFVTAMNEVLNVGARRELAGRSHVPTRILHVLLIYLLVASGVLGFILSRDGRGRGFTSTMMMVLFTLALVLIVDIDNPRSGTIGVPQRAIQELNAMLDQDAALRAARQSPSGEAAATP